jgi:hypothetical protein
MFAAAEIPSLDIVACFIQDRHSLLFRKREDGRKVGDFDADPRSECAQD